MFISSPLGGVEAGSWNHKLLHDTIQSFYLLINICPQGSMKDVGGEEQGLSNVKVMCRLCFSGENEGGESARKFMSCKCCGKKYHRSCLKVWGQHRGTLIGHKICQFLVMYFCQYALS